MKKKVLSRMLAAALLVGCLGGCGEKKGETTTTAPATDKSADTTAASTETGDTEETEKATEETGESGFFDANNVSGEITVLTHRTDLVETKMKEYGKAFEEKYPGTTVKFEAMEDYEGDVSTRLSTGDYGDVLMIPNTIPVAEFADFLEPLGELDKLAADYDKNYLYQKQSGGIVYGLPSGANIGNGVVYNKAVFEKAGVTVLPKTPEEFSEALNKIKTNTDAIPLYTNTHDSWTMAQWQSCVAAASGDPTYISEVMANDPTPFDAGKPAYTVYKVLYDAVSNKLTEADPFTTEWEGSKTMMAKGEVGCMVLGSWAVGQMKDVASEAGLNPDDVSYMPFPVSNAAGEVVVGAAPDYCYGVNVNSGNKDTAKAYIEFMLKDSGYAIDNGEISIVNGDPLPATLSEFEGVAFQVDLPATPENEGKWDAVHNESELALWSGSEYQVGIVEAAFGNVDKSFDDIMGEWNEKWSAALEAVNEDWGK